MNLLFNLPPLPLLRPHSLVFVQGHLAGPTIRDGLNRLGKAGGLYSSSWAPEMAMLPVPTEAEQRLFSLVGFHLKPHQLDLVHRKCDWVTLSNTSSFANMRRACGVLLQAIVHQYYLHSEKLHSQILYEKLQLHPS